MVLIGSGERLLTLTKHVLNVYLRMSQMSRKKLERQKRKMGLGNKKVAH